MISFRQTELSRQQQDVEVNFSKKFEPSMHSDFKQYIINSDHYVDKSLFIQKIVQIKQSIIFFTRPKLWGKSLNLTMLKYFFQASPTQNNVQSRNNYANLFQGGEYFSKDMIKPAYLSQLKICKQFKDYHLYMGKYPVIYLQFKIKAKQSYEYFETTLLDQLYQEYKSREYLNYNEKTKKLYKQCFNNLQNKIIYSKNKDNNTNFIDLLMILIKLLKKYHSRKCFVLIDDLDSLVIQMVTSTQKNNSQLIKVVEFYQILYQKFNLLISDIQKIVMTGSLSTINNLHTNTKQFFYSNLTCQKFAPYFGFNDKEVQQIINKLLNKQNYQQKYLLLYNRCREWHNGYYNLINNQQYNLYNPWSTIRYLRQCTQKRKILKGYDPNLFINDSDHYIKRILSLIFKRSKCLETILKCIQVPLYCSQCIQQDDCQNKIQMELQPLKQFKLIQIFKSQHWNQKQLTLIMLNLGYITGRIKNNKLLAYVPNKAIRNQLHYIFAKWFNSEKLVTNQKFIDITNLDDYITRMQQYFNELKDKVEIFNEAHFNCLFHTLYLLTHTKAFGHGCRDNIFVPITQQCNLTKKLIIHEYKFADTYQQVKQKGKKLIEDALWQIVILNYIKVIEQLLAINKDCITSVLIRGISLIKTDSQNNVVLKAEQIQLNMAQSQQIIIFFQNSDLCFLIQQKNDVKAAKKQLMLIFGKYGKAQYMSQIIILILNKQIKQKVLKDITQIVQQMKKKEHPINQRQEKTSKLPNKKLNSKDCLQMNKQTQQLSKTRKKNKGQKIQKELINYGSKAEKNKSKKKLEN